MARQALAGLAGIHLKLAPVVPPEAAAVLPVGEPPPAGLSAKEHARPQTLGRQGQFVGVEGTVRDGCG